MRISFSSIGFCILGIILLLCSGSVLGGGNETDQRALLEIKTKITNDPLGILSSWNMSVHFCQWQGVACGRKHQRVIMLNLKSQRLMGSISPHLGNLSFLRVLSFRNNGLTGKIPAVVGHLRRLQILNLSHNLLSGQIPVNISGCSNLNTLELGFNRLEGRIPEDLSFLLNLHLFNVEFNNLTGRIPPFLGNFSSLEALGATRNNFVGSIPETLGNLKMLYFLSMGENMLSGIIPSSLYNISAINVFSFPRNQLRGTLPSELGNMFPSLVFFSIGDNQFTGSLPLSLSNASNLETFTIALNWFGGNVPSLEKLHKLSWLSISTNQLGTGQTGDLNFLSTISNATSLKLLAINANNFGGVLPNSITNFTSLEIVVLSKNQIFGSIPTGLGDLVNLEMLYMGSNQLTGDIPEEIGKLQHLKMLSLLGNKFSGNVPSSFGNLTQLTHLYMQQNSLSGSIPPSIGKLQNLLSLDLNQNNLSGEIPKEILSIPSLAIYVGLSKNHLTGSVPTEVGTLTNLATLDISDNRLSREIPASLGSCISLEFLYMQNNFFQGDIPVSLTSLKGIEVLDLSHNNLTGKIPEFFQNFSLLQRLNLSFNDFEGMVPEEGVFRNSTATSVAGNRNLCGGIAEFQLPPCPNNNNTKKARLTLATKLVIAASGLLCAALVLSSLFLLLKKRKRPEPILSSSSLNPFLLTSYQHLLKATGGFSSTSFLGMGSFGSVYKGILEDGGTLVAVKVLNMVHPGASKSFKAECKVLSNVRHRNLVKLISACSSVDHRGNDFKALVYEFMVNGSLEEWLHPICRINESPNSHGSLNFIQRLNIAIDVASALEYLFEGCKTPIIHCDIKPSNVLLDDEMVGHVGDFGLARFFAESVGNNSDIRSSTIGVRGTIGYTAPEYGTGNGTSTSGDVYAYGILLLEMFTGKRPTDEMFTEGMNLHTYTKYALKERATEEILDPILVQEINGDITKKDPESSTYEGRGVEECIHSIIEIGVACSADLPSERMNISLVASNLLAIKEKLKPMFG